MGKQKRVTELLSRVFCRLNDLSLYSLKAALLIVLVNSLQACATYRSRALSMRSSLLQGQPQQALAIAQAKDRRHKNVIASLDTGMLWRINHHYATSNKIFEIARQEIEALYGVSVTENLAAVTINETLRSYQGDHYERLLLHAFMAMNYIQLNDLDDARVEMLQADVNMQAWHDTSYNDAFVRYLAGMIFEALGQDDDALISYRRAYQRYRDKIGLEAPRVPFNLQHDLLRLTTKMHLWNEYKQYKKTFALNRFPSSDHSQNDGQLVIILNNGLAPVRGEAAINIYAREVQKQLRVAFPVYLYPKTSLMRARIRIDNKQLGLETVEDIDALARHALTQAMPGIMARAIARAVIKYQSQLSAKKHSDLEGLLMTVTNLITERADTRSWTTLPEEIQLQRVFLPAGRHNVHIDMRNAAGQVVDSFVQTVTINPHKLTFLIHRWIAPVKKQPVKKQGRKENDSQSTNR